jgi:hypothetical protein
MKYIQAAMDGAYDPPQLCCKIDRSDFFTVSNNIQLPERWRTEDSTAPGQRPWMVHELVQLATANLLRSWALTWPGADPSVPPCLQTVGTYDAGMKRWNQWIRDRKGLFYYAQRR